jgi:hypothetical protein
MTTSKPSITQIEIGSTQYCFYEDTNTVVINGIYAKTFMRLLDGGLIIFKVKSDSYDFAGKYYSVGSDMVWRHWKYGNN